MRLFRATPAYRLRRRRRLLATLVAGLVVALPATAQIARLPHADTTAGNFFGNAAAIDGSLALIGAIGEAACGDNAGAAYVFTRDPADGTWTQQARLAPDDCRPGHFFGRSVALSGRTALVAASSEFFSVGASNAAYVFEQDPATGTWRQTARLTAAADAPEEGAFAASVALDGDRALITTSGDPVHGRYHGAAYVFERDPGTGTWARTARLVGDDARRQGIFGGAGVLDGDRVAVAASTYFADRPGSIYLFERHADGAWHQTDRLARIDDFFISLDLDGDRLLVGESKQGRSQAGAATLFERTPDGTWQRRATLRPRRPFKLGAFGTAVSLHGETALVVGYDEQLGQDTNIDRVVYVFRYDAAAERWEQRHIIDIGAVAFGSAVDHDQAFALIGHVSDRSEGSAYVVNLH